MQHTDYYIFSMRQTSVLNSFSMWRCGMVHWSWYASWRCHMYEILIWSHEGVIVLTILSFHGTFGDSEGKKWIKIVPVKSIMTKPYVLIQKLTFVEDRQPRATSGISGSFRDVLNTDSQIWGKGFSTALHVLLQFLSTKVKEYLEEKENWNCI